VRLRCARRHAIARHLGSVPQGIAIYIAGAFVLVRPGIDELLRIGRDAIRSRRR